jgi:chromosome segregation ATPase
MAESHDERQDRPKRNWGAEIDELRRQIQSLNSDGDKLRAEVKKFQAELKTKCGFCEGTGKEKDLKGRFVSDAAGLPRPCRICRGKGRS